jgi:predicted transcriptional regulator
MLVEPILSEVFPNETGAARLQQIGLFTLIFMFQGEAEPVTEARLAALSGHSQSHINRQLKKLLAIGVIERTAALGPHGRGRAWHLSVKHTPQTQALAKALFAGATAHRSSSS